MVPASYREIISWSISHSSLNAIYLYRFLAVTSSLKFENLMNSGHKMRATRDLPQEGETGQNKRGGQVR